MNKFNLLLSVAFFAIGTLGFQAQAQSTSTYTIEMNNAEFNGSNQMIFLRQGLANAYPNTDFNNAELRQVRLFAKSRRGQGQAELIVNNSPRDRAGIPESNGRFNSNLPRTYNLVRLNPNGASRGNWRVALDGNIKVQKVEVRVRGAVDAPEEPVSDYVLLGNGDTTVILPLVQVFQVNQTGVKSLQIQASGNLMVVSRVEVVFNNGSREILSGLEGQYYGGQSREVPVSNSHVRRVTVTALSAIPFGATATYQVFARVR